MNYGFLKMKKKITKFRILSNNKDRWLSVGLDTRFWVLRFPFFFLFFFLARVSGDKRLLFMNSSRTIWLFNPFLAHQWIPCTVHKTHKSHFSTTFSLKMGLTVLFTHLKIILLQYFQFSKISSIFKWTLNLENLIYYINYFVETEVMAKCQNEANDKRKKKTTSVCSARVARVKERKKRS